MNNWIYLDHAATTKPAKEVVAAMLPFMEDYYGNAGSTYGLGVESNRVLNQSRRSIAKTIGAKPEEIIFTSGGTEADNLAVFGVAFANQEKGKHIITSKIEHPAVLEACKRLEQIGFSVTYINVDENGLIKIDELEHAIRPDTILISVMYANNEVGTIQPIREIARISKEHRILFHVDAVQAYGQLPISVREEGIDLLSVSGHKCNGPKGIGFLYAKQYIKLAPYLLGGHQETGMRAGTENIPAIVGMAKAAELAHEYMEERIRYEIQLRNYFAYQLMDQIPNIHINGVSSEIMSENCGKPMDFVQSECGKIEALKRLPGNLHVSFPGFEAQQILIHLDRKGICASGGSACTARDGKPSHVLTAMGKSVQDIKGAIRFSLGYENTKEEIEQVVEVLKDFR